MSTEDYSLRERRRLIRRRASSALLWGLVGAAIGIGLNLYFRLYA